MNLDYEKLLAEDHELTEFERALIIEAYHKMVVEMFMDGVVFPIAYLVAVFCALSGLVKVCDTLIK